MVSQISSGLLAGNLQSQITPVFSNTAASTPSYQHLGGNCTPELQEKIDEWAKNQTSLCEQEIERTKEAFISCLKSPEGWLLLEEVYLEPLYPILFDPTFAGHVETLIIDRCSVSEECNALEPFLAEIPRFCNLKKLSLAEDDFATFPESIFTHENLKRLEIFECTICPSLKPIDFMIRFKNLTYWSVNNYRFDMDDSIRHWLNQLVGSEFFRGLDAENREAFKENLSQFLKLANEDAEFGKTFVEIIGSAAVVDEQMLALSILRIGQAFGLRLAQGEGLKPYARYIIDTVWPLELLQQVSAQIGLTPVETSFILLEKLRSDFTWDIKYFPSIPYFQSREVTQENLEMVKAYIQERLNNVEAMFGFLCEFLLKRPEWIKYLESQFPVEYNEGVLQLAGAQDDAERHQIEEAFHLRLVHLTRFIMNTVVVGSGSVERSRLQEPQQTKRGHFGS